ncbi:unnamed protein product [Lactuca virosa]|uniref:Reverse transcriptase zinc-binding domain-containing protein n=1 Tax=Lactuca virosa TaxID=75947 RepID=A0AAU9MHX0_9ASTR|nr:unnamed protein product [Lactuca virosa]
MRRRIEQQRNSYITLPTFKWNKTSPIKVNCFIWRAMQMRIPSAVALRVRGVGSIPVTCVACIGGVECVDHLLLNCPYACETRNDRIFNGVFRNPTRGAEDIKSLVYFWIKCRGNEGLHTRAGCVNIIEDRVEPEYTPQSKRGIKSHAILVRPVNGIVIEQDNQVEPQAIGEVELRSQQLISFCFKKSNM